MRKLKSTITSPYGDRARCELMAQTNVGICFRHPTKGVCGMRFDSMTVKEKTILGLL